VLVFEPNASDVQLEWAHPMRTAMLEVLRRQSALVRLDPHPAGLAGARSEPLGLNMTRIMTATEAKAKFLALLDEVEAGEEIEITRRGVPVARIRAARGPRALENIFKGVARSNVDRVEDLYGASDLWEST